QQRVAELRSAGERGRPVAGIHIAYGDEIAGAEEGDELLPHRPGRPRLDRAEHVGERRLARRAPPARHARGGIRVLCKQRIGYGGLGRTEHHLNLISQPHPEARTEHVRREGWRGLRMDFPSWGTFHPQSISDENNLQVQLRGASKWNWDKRSE